MVTRIGLFPGQGAQYPGMGKDLYDQSKAVRDLFDLASEASGNDMRDILFSGDEELLKRTEYTQSSITLVNIAAYTLLQDAGIDCDIFAGFSLGELSAYYAAGIIDCRSLFEITSRRGKIMAEEGAIASASVGELGMAAVIGLGYDTVADVLKQQGLEHLYIANDNSSKQVVLAGLKDAIDAVSQAIKEAGARRVIPLKVSGPFHTPLMQGAADRFSTFLDTCTFKDPKSAVFTNVHGGMVLTAEEAKSSLAKQLTSPVRWTKIVDDIVKMTKDEIDGCYEIGPGKVLTGFWKAGSSQSSCIPIGTWESLNEVITAGGR